MTGIINFNRVDTTPGSGSWAAPSKPVENYQQWLIEQMSRSLGVAQYFGMLARLHKKAGISASYPEEKPVIEGTYANDLFAAITRHHDFIYDRAEERRKILTKAEVTLKKQQDKESDKPKKRAPEKKSADNTAKPRPEVAVTPVEDWTPSEASKEKSKEFMANFRKSLSQGGKQSQPEAKPQTQTQPKVPAPAKPQPSRPRFL